MTNENPSTINFLPKTYLFCGDETYKGVCFESVDAIEKRMAGVFLHNVKYCISEAFSPKLWQPLDLAVFPGGSCTDWDELLGKEKMKDFFAWFMRGGRVLGICAGAYYLCASSAYQVGVDRTITRLRDAALFSGACHGPLFDPGIRVVKIRWEETQQEGHVLTIGGGCLIPCTGQEEFQVLARFLDKPHAESIAVISCKKGKGVGVLTTVHWEFDSSHLVGVQGLLEKNPEEIRAMVRDLDESAPFRAGCFKKIMDELMTI